MKRFKNVFVSTTFADDDSKISEVLKHCKKENICYSSYNLGIQKLQNKHN